MSPLARLLRSSLRLGVLDMNGTSQLLALAAALCVAGCADDEFEPRSGDYPVSQPPPVVRVVAPLPAAHCEINVDGIGLVDAETDYLPGVVCCENGGAEIEALKAQAIAARSVAYYEMETSGSICNSQGCQVYTCGHCPGGPSALHVQAVAETSGLYMLYENVLTYGFYVAGDTSPAAPACIGVSGATEQFVTYNDGLSGTDVEQTTLGLVIPPGDPVYGQNRGCMGQWSARCLESEGSDDLEILRFFYGQDIELDQAQGSCILEGVDTGGSTDSGGAGTTTATPGSSGGGSNGGPDAGSGPDPSAEGGGTVGGDDNADGAGTAAIDDGLPDTFGGDEDDGACGCRSGRRVPWALALLVIVGLRRRNPVLT